MSFVKRYYNKEYIDCYIFRFASTPQPSTFVKTTARLLWNAHETLINNNQPYAKTLLKISVFAWLLIVYLRIRHALRSGVSLCPYEPKIKPANAG